jgi:hypothetical protein
MSDQGKQIDSMVCCEACGTTVPSYDVVNYGSIEQGSRQLCIHCFNAEVASTMGLDYFENVRLDPIVMADCAGQKHEFHFRLRLLGAIVSLESFELTVSNGPREAPTGYQFQIIGTPDDEPLSLLGRLIERMRRTLSVKHLVRGEHGMQIADFRVSGRIRRDASEGGQLPLLIIDGQEVSWDQLGRMLMGFEGWQFRIDICDRSEEV